MSLLKVLLSWKGCFNAGEYATSDAPRRKELECREESRYTFLYGHSPDNEIGLADECPKDNKLRERLLEDRRRGAGGLRGAPHSMANSLRQGHGREVGRIYTSGMSA